MWRGNDIPKRRNHEQLIAGRGIYRRMRKDVPPNQAAAQ